MKDEIERDQSGNQPRPRRRLWLWFVAGFLLVFVGMSIAITMYSLTPSGDAVLACKLWKYYIIETRRALFSSNMLGPTTGSGSAAIRTALQHFLCSVAGGVGMLGMGWVFYKVKGR